jgi:hypothetical protein
VGESGTAIGMDEREVTRAANVLVHTGLYRVTVELDERNQTLLTVTPQACSWANSSTPTRGGRPVTRCR